MASGSPPSAAIIRQSARGEIPDLWKPTFRSVSGGSASGIRPPEPYAVDGSDVEAARQQSEAADQDAGWLRASRRRTSAGWRTHGLLLNGVVRAFAPKPRRQRASRLGRRPPFVVGRSVATPAARP